MLLSLFLFSTKPTFGTYVLDLLFVGLLESPLLAAAWLGIRGLRQGRYSGATAWAAKALVCLLALMSGGFHWYVFFVISSSPLLGVTLSIVLPLWFIIKTLRMMPVVTRPRG